MAGAIELSDITSQRKFVAFTGTEYEKMDDIKHSRHTWPFIRRDRDWRSRV
ncbi:hypothetical protein ATPR_3000 [Acetobacter tropicalis NBRC 101654]|uniref:Uncharacterized protein n=1 Tax=Acetobacter tropicalis NBRC 101654 TaxID=749388 RepID=F7VI01_9PROT|nr:hypothetical protein ATPR_3000 [Acetobacter tropicalis NBRC 101654]